MRSYLSNLLVKSLFLSSAIFSTHAVRPFTAPKSPLTSQALELRGGGWNPPDGIATAKAITNLGLVVGTATSLSAKTVLDKSGSENAADPLVLLLTRRIGVSILGLSIASYCLFFQDASVSTAVGISGIPSVVELSKTLFDGTHKDLGFPAAGQALALSVNAIISFSLLNGSQHLSKDTVLKIHSGWLLTNGVLMGCFPKLASKIWGEIDATGLSVFQYFVSLWGFSLLSLGTLSACVVAGTSTGKALAFGALLFVSRFGLGKFLW